MNSVPDPYAAVKAVERLIVGFDGDLLICIGRIRRKPRGLNLATMPLPSRRITRFCEEN